MPDSDGRGLTPPHLPHQFCHNQHTNKSQAMNGLETIIMPVLARMPASHLKLELIGGFAAHGQCFESIEWGFRRLTSDRHGRETLCRFFHSWAQTNNSAMTVVGIGNRMTLMVREGRPIADEAALLRALVSLDRIVDEDLAVTNRTLHSQLFYDMATGIVGDDDWLSHRYIHPEALAFKAWKDANSLREEDLVIALLTTLVHEIYTHGEVEFILPLFQRWLREHLEFDDRQSARILAWITVHCGPTEKNHFFHALDAVGHYSDAMDLQIKDYSLGEIVGTYLRRKASLLEALFPDVAVIAH
jgi:hypothetical protein